MHRVIRGISKSSLWNAWKTVRKELKRIQPRDIVDHLEYDVDPDVWIRRLLNKIASGRYEPESPERSKEGKSLGFSRTITHPSIPDVVLYRAIADYLFARAKSRQHRHVYFHRGDAKSADGKRLEALGIDPTTGRKKEDVDRPNTPALSRALPRQGAVGPNGPNEKSKVDPEGAYDDGPGYTAGGAVSLSWFINWKLMTLYRRELIEPKAPERWFVLTDITNFFDSVLHDHVAESLREFRIPPRMIGLLLFLLERLAVRNEYAHSPAIGLPVEPFDGSRTIAHLVLFTYDDDLAPVVGEESYIRWMDDQLLVVDSYERALAVLGTVQASLSRLHLTPNAKKTKILSREEAFRHFHIDINRELDACYLLPYASPSERNQLARKVGVVCRSARRRIENGDGEAGKILRRFYLLAARARRRFLKRRCLADVLADPMIADRVCSYVRHVDSPAEFWRFAQEVIGHPRQVYADVNLTVVEHLLRLEPEAEVAKEIRSFALRLIKKPDQFVGGEYCAAVAPLLRRCCCFDLAIAVRFEG